MTLIGKALNMELKHHCAYHPQSAGLAERHNDLQNLQDCASISMFEVPAKSKGTMNDLRVVLLGKTGDGKSSCGNTILNEEVFRTGNAPNSETHKSESGTKLINEKKITVVDTPGIFDTRLSEKELKSEILQCFIECAPGAHAFVIVLKVARYTKQETEIVKEITALFGEEALKYAVVLFTRGDELSEDQRIEDFVKQSTELQGLVNKCGGRVHVIDNKYWNERHDDYRNNRLQVEKLLKTIEEMVRKNGGQYYSNEILQEVNRAIEVERQNIIRKSNKESQDINNNIIKQAKQTVHTKLSVRLVGVTVGALLGALFGLVVAPCLLVVVENAVTPKAAACVSVPTAIGVSVAGAAGGGTVGYDAVEGAETLTKAMKRSAIAVWDNTEKVYDKIEQLVKRCQKAGVIGKTAI
ncbi:hypothetical protein AOLI_G00106160 [Acnodon oligacanthus]